MSTAGVMAVGVWCLVAGFWIGWGCSWHMRRKAKDDLDGAMVIYDLCEDMIGKPRQGVDDR